MKSNRTQAFTRTDLVAVVAMIGLLAVLFVRAQEDPDAQARGERIRCVSNLKQIGLGLRIWSNDNGDKFPMQVKTQKGGSFEAIARGETFRHFAAMSNELSRPKILVCPSDDREPAPTFADLSNTNLSYFVGLDADETRPQTILSGDRNLTNGLPRPNGVLGLEPDRPAGWTAEIHGEKGNIGLADGSVQQASTAVLRRQIEASLKSVEPKPQRLQFPE
jgi:prepilin-type processing-associated H-X9-DG protein